MNTPLASVPFIGGVTRPVFLEDRPVYGVWVYIDEPDSTCK
jgi:hypothetical protein